jgi:hypothetical protein
LSFRVTACDKIAIAPGAQTERWGLVGSVRNLLGGLTSPAASVQEVIVIELPIFSQFGTLTEVLFLPSGV